MSNDTSIGKCPHTQHVNGWLDGWMNELMEMNGMDLWIVTCWLADRLVISNVLNLHRLPNDCLSNTNNGICTKENIHYRPPPPLIDGHEV